MKKMNFMKNLKFLVSTGFVFVLMLGAQGVFAQSDFEALDADQLYPANAVDKQTQAQLQNVTFVAPEIAKDRLQSEINNLGEDPLQNDFQDNLRVLKRNYFRSIFGDLEFNGLSVKEAVIGSQGKLGQLAAKFPQSLSIEPTEIYIEVINLLKV